jgi:hypothetical protein
MKVCECGCGQRVLVRYGVPLRFIHGHQNGTPKRRPDWPAEMVAFLVREKRRGQLTYEAAWKLALIENPPRSRDMGEMAPTLFGTEMPLVEFLHEAAWAAWHDFTSDEPGQGKALGRFRVDMLASWGDSSEPAARMARAA